MTRHVDYLDRTLVWAIEQAQAGKLDGLIVSMPPQHGKSELCSKHLPAWYLGNYPDHRVILTSYEADFAGSWGKKARDLLERFGDLFGVAVSRNSSAKNRWDLEGREGGMTTAGVGGAITGKGAHLLIVDDPLKNDEEARSPQHRQKQWEWWQSVASTRLRPGALSLVVQTRWNRDDLTGRLIKESKENGQRWHVVKPPALAEENDPLGRTPGEALWPEMYTREYLEKVRAGKTNYYWRAMYQQDPVAEGGAEWPESFFGPQIWFEEWPREWAVKVMSLDPSKGTESKFGDYSAFVLAMLGLDGTVYVDADLEIRHTSVIADTAVELSRWFQPDGFAIEVNQFQSLLHDEIDRRARQRNLIIPIYPVTNTVNKLVRIRRLTPYLAGNHIRFKHGSAGAKLLVEQLRDFPLGEHDDGPDAAEVALRLMQELVACE